MTKRVSVMRATGLYTSPNKFTSVPPGALSEAKNVIIKNDGLVEPRPGLHDANRAFGATNSKGNATGWAIDGDGVEVNYVYHSGGKVEKALVSATTYTNLGTYGPYGDYMRFVEAQQTMLFNSSVGVKQNYIDSSSTVREAGIYQAMDVRLPAVGAGSTGTGAWLATGQQVAYKALWGKYVDEPNRTVLGNPSGSKLYQNTSGSTQYVNLYVPVPLEAQATDMFRVYRTPDVATTVDVGVDYRQILEYPGVTGAYQTVAIGNASIALGTGVVTVNLTGHGLRNGVWIYITTTATNFDTGFEQFITVVNANQFTYVQANTAVSGTNNQVLTIRASFVTAIDYVPSLMRQDPLYTNPTDGDSELGGNVQPPLCKDMALWNNCVWYANTKSRQRFFLTMLGAGPVTGVQNNDTITIGGTVFTAVTATPAFGTNQFQITTSGTPSFNVRKTAEALCEVVNRNIPGGITASYIQASLDSPFGQILLQESAIGGSTLSITASRVQSWLPNLDVTLSTNFEVDEEPATIMFSKPNEPEAVPLVNSLPIGDPSRAIQRVIPMRDSLWVFKEDGLFRVTGNYPNFSVTQFDKTVRLIGPQTPQVTNGKLFCFSSKGVLAITEAGAQIVSAAIENQIFPAQTYYDIGAFSSFSGPGMVGLGIDDLKLYLLGYENRNSGIVTTTYALATDTGTWVEWPISWRIGSVSPRGRVELFTNPNTAVGASTVTNSPVALERYDTTLVTNSALTYADSPTVSPSGAFVSTSNTITISAIVGNVLTVSGTHGIVVGDVIYELGGTYPRSVVTVVNGASVTLASSAGFATGTAYKLKPVVQSVKWNPYFGSGPEISKQFSEVTLTFQKINANVFTASFSTDSHSTATTSALHSRNYVLYAQPTGIESYRLLVPAAQQRAQTLTVGFSCTEAFAYWQAAGFSVMVNDSGTTNANK